jgi:hypothetical protein
MWSFTAVLATLVLSNFALAARYDITLYSNSGCGGETYTCSDIKKKRCCAKDDGATKYHAAKVRESGSSTCSDELRIYKYHDSACGLSLGQNDDGTCLNAGKQEVAGATVYESGFFKRDDEPVEVVAPDVYGYENGTTRYVIKLDSPEGRTLEAMERYGDRIEYAVQFGVPEEIKAVTKRQNCEKLPPGQGGIIRGGPGADGPRLA